MSIYGITLRFLNATQAFLPARWRLAIRYHAWLTSHTVEPELVHLFELCRNFRTAIDIGANHGMYTYKMAQKFERVFAFEPNQQEDFDIHYWKKANVRLLPYGLSDAPQVAQLYIPIHKGHRYNGWASVGQRDLPFADAIEQVAIELQRLDDQPFVREHPIDLIKIDVEGHELEVLNGGLETIRQHKPVLIIEHNETQAAEIGRLLLGLGYRSLSFSEFSQRELPSPNRIYFPL